VVVWWAQDRSIVRAAGMRAPWRRDACVTISTRADKPTCVVTRGWTADTAHVSSDRLLAP
jgi:hypothetical protein